MFEQLAELGLDIRIFAMARPKEGQWNPKIFRWPTAPSFIYKWLAIRKELHVFVQPDEKIIVHDLFYPKAAWFKKRRCLFVNSKNIRNIISFYNPTAEIFLSGKWRESWSLTPTLPKLLVYARRALEELSLEWIGTKMADGVTGNSDNIIEGVRSFYSPNDRLCRVIPTSIDSSFWHSSPSPKISGSNLPSLLFVGTLTARKGIYDFLLIAAAVAKAFGGVQCRIAGRTLPETDDQLLRKMLSELKLTESVVRLGNISRDELRTEYWNCDVMVLPTHYEGSPRVVKEALACGCPVVASRIPGVKSIDPSEKFIQMVPPHDVTQFAAKVERVLMFKSFRHEISNLGSSAMFDNFSRKKIANRWFDFYNELFQDSN